jgi:hypothetical protein
MWTPSRGIADAEKRLQGTKSARTQGSGNDRACGIVSVACVLELCRVYEADRIFSTFRDAKNGAFSRELRTPRHRLPHHARFDAISEKKLAPRFRSEPSDPSRPT